MAEGSAPRVAAALAVRQVLERGRSLSEALPEQQRRLRAEDRALAQELSYGVLRWHRRLEALSHRLLRKPLKRKDSDLQLLLQVGLYQLEYMDTPAHAAVGETVGGAAKLGKGWAKGLINGVLRNAMRRQEALGREVDADPATRHAHPDWLLDRLREAWPDRWEAVAAANNARPPMVLRVNLDRQPREEYLLQLDSAGLNAGPARWSPAGVVLERPAPVEALPGFARGMVSVQDMAAQLAAPLLDAAPGERVLDACAAPGGKTGHILELCPGARVTAIDKSAERLARVRENLDRLGARATLTAGDAADPDSWWDGEPFDRILLDAPCSGTGVIRRHPDIKWLRRDEDIPRLVAEQRRLLEHLWPLLRRGGMLVYATCSVLPEENERQIRSFLDAEASARELPPEVGWGRPGAAGRQILPGEDGMDGFFYARLQKR